MEVLPPCTVADESDDSASGADQGSVEEFNEDDQDQAADEDEMDQASDTGDSDETERSDKAINDDGSSASDAMSSATKEIETEERIQPSLPLSLGDEIFSKEFDPSWVQVYGLDPQILQGFTSPKHLEQMIAPGYVKEGDWLVLVEKWSYGEGKEDKKIIKKAILEVKGGQGYPDADLWFNEEYVKKLKDFHGPSKIIEAFNEHSPTESTTPVRAWKELEVVRDGVHISNLHDLRNSCQVWEEQKLLWQQGKDNAPDSAPKATKRWDHRVQSVGRKVL